ncbi:MAG: T9SS type A sorting domain-containing protein [Paludibacteraceae bacterium]|nr:T9SS type A sorting domain-containing protein [Paludibacteraceae bacterium]MBR4713120.1 T9SS type A sorting domain-containing protein [Paludibacteraceae bacterium]
MLKQVFMLAALTGVPILCHSQANVYSSAAEKAENDMTFYHVVGNAVALEAEGGTLSTGNLIQYSVATTTGMEFTDVTLLSVYPNPTKDVLVLRTGELKKLTMTLTNAEGQQLLVAPVRESETRIDFSRYASGLYNLTLTSGKSVVKSFSIIKR